jgi:chromosome partitioning protein
MSYNSIDLHEEFIMPQTIAVTGDKGGTGKSTISILLAEWCSFGGKSAQLLDADPAQTTQIWVEKCQDQGYYPSEDHGIIRIVDTAATSGTSLQRYIIRSDVIILPCQLHAADLETVIGWYLSINPSLQDRVIFLPNRLSNTVEQRRGLEALEGAVASQGRGRITSGIANRPAVYPPVLNGLGQNFFASHTHTAAANELSAAFQPIVGEMI